MAFHGEYAAIAFGHGVHGADKVGGVCRRPKIVDHVAGGHDAQSGTEQDGSVEDGFVISLLMLAVALAHEEEVAPELAFLDEATKLLHIERVVQKRVMFIPLVYHTPPACPSPDGEGGGEEVVVGHIRGDFFGIESGNHADAGVVLVLVEHLFAEAEEGDGRDAVIFKNNAFIAQGEGPLLRIVVGGVAAGIYLLIIVVYIAFPVYLRNNLAAGFYPRHITFAACPVLIEEKP